MMKSKTILIGNGINYLGGTPISWSNLLKELMQYNQFNFDELPNVMAYEKIRMDWQAHHDDEDSSRLKEYIAQKLKSHPGNETCKKILDSGFNNYITTNYDHAIENTFTSLDVNNTLFSPEKDSQKGEKYYSIRRKTELQTNKKTVGTIWHIHGEIDPCKSIMLGFNHYVGSLAKVDSYLKGTYVSDSNPDITKDMNIKKIQAKLKENFYNEKLKMDVFKQIIPYLKSKYLNLNRANMGVKKISYKVENNDYDGLSWIELFFNSNIHIVGFGFDFYEIDLWNILTKRARLNSQSKIDNKIYYYTKPLNQVKAEFEKAEIRKREMLRNLSVEVIEVKLHKNSSDKDDYERQWDEFIEIMRKN